MKDLTSLLRPERRAELQARSVAELGELFDLVAERFKKNRAAAQALRDAPTAGLSDPELQTHLQSRQLADAQVVRDQAELDAARAARDVATKREAAADADRDVKTIVATLTSTVEEAERARATIQRLEALASRLVSPGIRSRLTEEPPRALLDRVLALLPADHALTKLVRAGYPLGAAEWPFVVTPGDPSTARIAYLEIIDTREKLLEWQRRMPEDVELVTGSQAHKQYAELLSGLRLTPHPAGRSIWIGPAAVDAPAPPRPRRSVIAFEGMRPGHPEDIDAMLGRR